MTEVYCECAQKLSWDAFWCPNCRKKISPDTIITREWEAIPRLLAEFGSAYTPDIPEQIANLISFSPEEELWGTFYQSSHPAPVSLDWVKKYSKIGSGNRKPLVKGASLWAVEVFHRVPIWVVFTTFRLFIVNADLSVICVDLVEFGQVRQLELNIIEIEVNPPFDKPHTLQMHFTYDPDQFKTDDLGMKLPDAMCCLFQFLRNTARFLLKQQE